MRIFFCAESPRRITQSETTFKIFRKSHEHSNAYCYMNFQKNLILFLEYRETYLLGNIEDIPQSH